MVKQPKKCTVVLIFIWSTQIQHHFEELSRLDVLSERDNILRVKLLTTADPL